MLTLAQLADFLGGVWHGNANHAILGYSSLLRASDNEVAYYNCALPRQMLSSSVAGAVLIKAEHSEWCSTNTIIVPDPYSAMEEVAKLFDVQGARFTGIHPTAQIHPSAQIGNYVSIGAHAVIGEFVFLGDGVCIGANAIIDPDVSIGDASIIGNGVFVHSGTFIASQVMINSGCVIGSSPFNYLKQHGVWKQGFDVGGVYLSAGVHLGANTVIDRGSLGDTFLAEGVCVDNLVHIAHDVSIGCHTAIAGCAVIGAHAGIGSDCIIGGASCLAAYVQIIDDVVITGMSTVSKSIMKSGIYSSGTLVHEHQRWRKNAARFKRLDDYMIKLAALEKSLQRLYTGRS